MALKAFDQSVFHRSLRKLKAHGFSNSITHKRRSAGAVQLLKTMSPLLPNKSG